jgi:CubicO group peptidase (beta-lactamase class C family)
MAWAGIYNTFFWIDPTGKTTAVLMMQLLPFMDDAAKALFEEFEQAVYGSTARKTRTASAARIGDRVVRLSWRAPLSW